MMFAALHELARRAALHLLIVAEGERLRVTLQPRPTGDSTPVPPALQLVATPAEFDAGFVEAVRTYQAPATSLLEQAAGAAQAVSAAAEEQKTATVEAPAKAAKKAAGKKTAKTKTPPHIVAAQQRAALERAAKAGEDAGATSTPAETTGAPAETTGAPAETTGAPAAAAPRFAETMKAAAAERKAAALRAREDKKAAREAEAVERRAAAQAKREAAAARRAEKGPGRNASPADIEAARVACIADARGYLALIGDAKPSRSAFLATMPPTGRRYERLFVSWNEFMDAARQQDLPIVAANPPAADTAPASVATLGEDIDRIVAVFSHHPTQTAPDGPLPEPVTPPTEPVTLANMEAPPAQATDGLFTGDPQLEGDEAPATPAPVATPVATPAPTARDLEVQGALNLI